MRERRPTSDCGASMGDIASPSTVAPKNHRRSHSTPQYPAAPHSTPRLRECPEMLLGSSDATGRVWRRRPPLHRQPLLPAPPSSPPPSTPSPRVYIILQPHVPCYNPLPRFTTTDCVFSVTWPILQPVASFSNQLVLR